MPAKEATARIKINRLLEAAGWRFFGDANGRANIALEPNVKLTQTRVDALGENFDGVSNGFVDFLLLDDNGFPLVVLEAKAEDKNPLVGKEQARRYAREQSCRYVILSNGNLHYFWDLQHGNPHVVTQFPNADSIQSYRRFTPDPGKLATEIISSDYIALTQLPGYASEAAWQNRDEKPAFIKKNNLRFLRDYQKRALNALQDAVAEGSSRFLFEMATGTGKTFVACALAQQACRKGFRVAYRRTSRLFEELALARADGSYARLLERFSHVDLLVLDDWGLVPTKSTERSDLLEILEDRFGVRSTLIASQLPTTNWHDFLADPTLADAILDRLVHNAHRIVLKGPSQRKAEGTEA